MPNGRAKRVVCFIDGSNLYAHLRYTFGNGKVNLPKLCGLVTGPGRKLVQWRFYGAPLPQGSTAAEQKDFAAQQRFFHYVRRHRKGALRLGRLQRDKHGTLHEKGVDVLVAIDLVRLAAEDAYDTAVLFSGDGDLVPAIQMVQDIYGKRVEVCLPKVPAYHVRQVADGYHEITAELFAKTSPAPRPR